MVDDEPQITRVLRTSLTAQGYEIRVANDGETALEIVKDFRPRPGDHRSGHAQHERHRAVPPICAKCRKSPFLCFRCAAKSAARSKRSTRAPMITSPSHSAPENCWRGFARLCGARRPAGSEPQTKIDLGDFHIDLDAHSVAVAGSEVRLTPKEFDVLVYMAQHPRKVLTHRSILNAVWGSNSVEQNEYLRVFVGQLRKKLEPDASSPKYILTEPWVGYRFEPGERD